MTGLKERYFEWVHQPVDQPIRLFHSDFLEFFSKCPWWLVPITWIPVTICLLLHSHATITASHSPVVWKLFGAGNQKKISNFTWGEGEEKKKKGCILELCFTCISFNFKFYKYFNYMYFYRCYTSIST